MVAKPACFWARAQVLGVFQAEELQEFLWTYPRPLPEQALKMEGTQVDVGGKVFQPGLFPKD